MEILDLDVKTYKFWLWELEFYYTPSEKDKKYFFAELLNFNEKEFDKEKLKNIFKNLLKKENILNIKYISDEDIFWLFNFFNSIF